MAHVLIRHKVADYGKFKPEYEAALSMREGAGLKELHFWRNIDDPNEVVILFHVSDVAKAKELTGSSELKERMQADGVQGVPDIVFLSDG